MQKTIGVFIDGTWNQPTDTAITNVRELFDSAAYPCSINQLPQPCYYVSGVGTSICHSHAGFRDDDAWAKFLEVRSALRTSYVPTYDWINRLAGGAWGKGTSARILEAYAFIVAHYKRGDRLHIFGFSRGALAARSLVGFLFRVGILLQDKLDKVEQAFCIYAAGAKGDDSELAVYLHQIDAGRMIDNVEDERGIVIHYLGVWDTVAALGPSAKFPLSERFRAKYHDVDLPPNVFNARHALSMHELRRAFEPVLWKSISKNHEQVWFPGAHADVGGGYPRDESHLAAAALRWVADGAEKYGLAVCGGRWWRHEEADAVPVLHHEIHGKFRLSSPSVRQALWNEVSAARDGVKPISMHPTTVPYLLSACDMLPRSRSSSVFSAVQRIDDMALSLLLDSKADAHIRASKPRWLSSLNARAVRKGMAMLDRSRGSITLLDGPDFEIVSRALIVFAWFNAAYVIVLCEQEAKRIQVAGAGDQAQRFCSIIDELDCYCPEVTSSSFGDRWRGMVSTAMQGNGAV